MQDILNPVEEAIKSGKLSELAWAEQLVCTQPCECTCLAWISNCIVWNLCRGQPECSVHEHHWLLCRLRTLRAITAALQPGLAPTRQSQAGRRSLVAALQILAPPRSACLGFGIVSKFGNSQQVDTHNLGFFNTHILGAGTNSPKLASL